MRILQNSQKIPFRKQKLFNNAYQIIMIHFVSIACNFTYFYIRALSLY